MIITYILLLFVCGISAYWDVGTTTMDPSIPRWDERTIRQSRFRWQRSEWSFYTLLFPWWNWYELEWRRKLYVVAGLSYEFINLSTAAILNRRTLITAANILDPYMDRQKDLRIWALGRRGAHYTPWRYRVWRVTRLFPKSLNPEHCHGPFCDHSPRHDVAIIHSFDQMYVYHYLCNKYAYAYRTYMTWKYQNLMRDSLWFASSAHEYLNHVLENYKIFYARTSIKNIIDCSKILPKWWGKFICLHNINHYPCIQNGGPFFDSNLLTALGCFSIVYNDQNYLIFTDLRYYIWWIYHYAHIEPGEYYEYAYPQWGATLIGYDKDWDTENPMIPGYQIRDTMYPLGKRK